VLTAGTRLGPYEITGSLGAGGMGEVYRATDTRLGRDVALKTLPAGLANDAEQRARFEREARAASSLNHPHICVIHDVGSDNGVDYLVMELLEGETAADCLARGPMPVADVMRLGAQVADALDRAHKKGLVHRDLKPANIMLVRPGSKSGPVQAKLLDFGLARPTATVTGTATMTKALTAAGTIVGTFQYMSPEQLEGRDVDGRTDIWSLGATLYEMATGAAAFEGTSTASLISAVLRDEPKPIAERVPLAPPAFQRVVTQCLAKDPDDRWQSAGDVKRELDWIASGGGSGSGMPAASTVGRSSQPKRHPLYTGAAIAAGAVGMLAAGWWIGQRAPAPDRAWSQYTQLTDASGVETSPTISPDGSTIAYASNAKGSWDIYVQRVGGRNPIVVAGDPARDELWPAFSPDGKQIAFNDGRKGGIFVVGATGESVRRLTDAGANPAWSPDGQRIVFAAEQVRTAYNREVTSTLWIIDVMSGGAPRKIDGGDAVQPSWSPSGARIAFWQNVNGQRDLATVPATGGAHQPVTSDASVDWAPVWSPDGRFLYFASDRGGSMGIWRIGIDEASGRTTSAPEAVAAGVDVSMDLPHFSANGSFLVFRSMTESVNPAAIAFDPVTERAGDIRLLQHRTGKLIPTDASRDGKWIALNNMYERQQDIFIMRNDGTELSRLTDDAARDWIPRFTPDTTALTFYSNKDGRYDDWSIRLDGGNRVKLAEFVGEETGSPIFAPDGHRLLFTAGTDDALTVVVGTAPWPVTRQTGTVFKVPTVEGGVFNPTTWSPDGRWWGGLVTLASGARVGHLLYDVAAGTSRQLNDDAGGMVLAWMPGSTRVVYFTAGGKLMIQEISSLKRHEVDVTLPLPPDEFRSIAASPDGRTLYYGAQQMEANIWKVEQPGVVKK
jgi:Tol biopolymer transport system component